MTIKLLPTQIPLVWEIIKWVCKQVNEIEEKALPAYCNELLQALLSNKAQCWIRLNGDKHLIALLITRLCFDKITDDKYIFLQALYSFVKVDGSVWQEEMKLMRDFSDKEGCKHIAFDSRHPRVWELAIQLGFKEKSRTFIFRGDN